MPAEKFDGYWEMKFIIKVQKINDLGETEILECKKGEEKYCTVAFKKHYTPVLHYVNPPVVYKGSTIELWFNSKGVQETIGELNSDDLPFVNAKIGEALIDFEGEVDHETTWPWWARTYVRGKVTDQPPGKNVDVNMLWEVGHAKKQKQEMTTCTFDEKECYTVKVVPVIHSISNSTGYTTGGQNMVIEGFGFDNATLDLDIAGVKCIPSFVTKTKIICTVPSTKTINPPGPIPGAPGVSRRFIEA